MAVLLLALLALVLVDLGLTTLFERTHGSVSVGSFRIADSVKERPCSAEIQ